MSHYRLIMIIVRQAHVIGTSRKLNESQNEIFEAEGPFRDIMISMDSSPVIKEISSREKRNDRRINACIKPLGTRERAWTFFCLSTAFLLFFFFPSNLRDRARSLQIISPPRYPWPLGNCSDNLGVQNALSLSQSVSIILSSDDACVRKCVGFAADAWDSSRMRETRRR